LLGTGCDGRIHDNFKTAQHFLPSISQVPMELWLIFWNDRAAIANLASKMHGSFAGTANSQSMATKCKHGFVLRSARPFQPLCGSTGNNRKVRDGIVEMHEGNETWPRVTCYRFHAGGGSFLTAILVSISVMEP
jgi:hypothetical protein